MFPAPQASLRVVLGLSLFAASRTVRLCWMPRSASRSVARRRSRNVTANTTIHDPVAEMAWLSRSMTHAPLIGALALAFMMAHSVSAQTQPAQALTLSADEVAAELANPNTTLGTLSLNLDTKWFGGDLPGAGDQAGFALLFQPSLPYALGGGTNLFVRPAVPFIAGQPLPTGDGSFTSASSAIGDIGFDVAVGKSFRGGWVLVGGMVGSLPTATNADLGLNRTLLGPEFLIAKISRRIVVGVLVTQSWNITHRDEFDTSITGGQYFVTIPLRQGWQISASPTFSYDRNAPPGEAWSFPVGGGVTKTSILGRTPWKFAAQYWYYVASPNTFGTRNQLRISVSPVIPLPW